MLGLMMPCIHREGIKRFSNSKIGGLVGGWSLAGFQAVLECLEVTETDLTYITTSRGAKMIQSSGMYLA